LKIAVKLGDAALAAKLRLLLSEVPGLTLVDDGEDARVVLPPLDAGPRLSAREQDVLALMAEGASNKEIAGKLAISASTVKFHIRRITDKLDAVGRTDAVATALQRRMIDI
jgi:DNA-binding CsgD family transcriptional regulator